MDNSSHELLNARDEELDALEDRLVRLALEGSHRARLAVHALRSRGFRALLKQGPKYVKRLALTGIVLMALFHLTAEVSAAIIPIPWLASLFHAEFVRDLGIALVVAAILAVTVDQYVKYDLAIGIARDAGKLVFERNLPKELKRELEAATVVNVIRRDLEIVVSFEAVDSGHLLMVTNVGFYLENLTDGEFEFPHGASLLIDKYSSVRPARISIVASEGQAIVDPYDLKPDEIDRDQVRDADGVALKLTRKATVKQNKGGWREAHFVARTELVVDRSDQEVWIMREPVIGVKMSIHIDPSLNIVPRVDICHRNGDSLPGREPRPSNPAWTWEFRDALPKMGAIVLNWQAGKTPVQGRLPTPATPAPLANPATAEQLPGA